MISMKRECSESSNSIPNKVSTFYVSYPTSHYVTLTHITLLKLEKNVVLRPTSDYVTLIHNTLLKLEKTANGFLSIFILDMLNMFSGRVLFWFWLQNMALLKGYL